VCATGPGYQTCGSAAYLVGGTASFASLARSLPSSKSSGFPARMPHEDPSWLGGTASEILCDIPLRRLQWWGKAAVVVVTTISCDVRILGCSRCELEAAIASATALPGTCTCGASMIFARACTRSFSLHKDGLLIRCIAENSEGWLCVEGGTRDYCPDHANLVDTSRSAARHDAG